MSETRIYIDSNVYIDYFMDRRDNLRPLGDLSHQLFSRTFECEFKIIISTFLIDEIDDLGFEKQFRDFLSQLKDMNKLETFKTTYEDKKLARKMHKSHFSDKVHYVMASKAKVSFIITRNWEDFYGLGEIKALPPEFI